MPEVGATEFGKQAGRSRRKKCLPLSTTSVVLVQVGQVAYKSIQRHRVKLTDE